MNNKEQKTEKTLKKLSLAEFINQGIEKESKVKKEVDLPIEGCGIVTFVKPTQDRLLEFLNSQANSVRMNKNEEIIGTNLIYLTEASKEFIYFCCPFLQNPELQKAWDIVDPLDTPVKAFGIENLIGIANQIKDAFGDEKETKNKIKN